MIWPLSHVWTTETAAGVSGGNAHRSGSSMCPARSCTTTWLLALVKSADHALLIAIFVHAPTPT
jgi:hypothetical protein